MLKERLEKSEAFLVTVSIINIMAYKYIVKASNLIKPSGCISINMPFLSIKEHTRCNDLLLTNIYKMYTPALPVDGGN